MNIALVWLVQALENLYVIEALGVLSIIDVGICADSLIK